MNQLENHIKTLTSEQWLELNKPSERAKYTIHLPINKPAVKIICNMNANNYYTYHIQPYLGMLVENRRVGGVDKDLFHQILNCKDFPDEVKKALSKLFSDYSKYDNETVFADFVSAIDVPMPFRDKERFENDYQKVHRQLKETYNKWVLIPPILISGIIAIYCLINNTSYWQVFSLIGLGIGLYFSKSWLPKLCLLLNKNKKELDNKVQKTMDITLFHHFKEQSIDKLFGTKLTYKRNAFYDQLSQRDMMSLRSLFALNNIKNVKYDLEKETPNNWYNLGFIQYNQVDPNERAFLTQQQETILANMKSLLFSVNYMEDKDILEKRLEQIYKYRNLMFLTHPLVLGCVSNRPDIIENIIMKVKKLP